MHLLVSSIRFVAGGAALLCVAASVCASSDSSLLFVTFFSYPTFPVSVLAFYFSLTKWVQPSHPASPRSYFVSGVNLVPTYRLLSTLPLSAAESFNDWGGGGGCHKFVSVLGGNGVKIAPPGDLFDQLPGEIS